MADEIALMVDIVSPLLKGLLVEQAIEEYAAQNLPGTFDSAKSTINVIVERAAKPPCEVIQRHNSDAPREAAQ